MTLNKMRLLVIYLLKIDSKSVQSSVYRYIIDTITSNAKYLCFDYRQAVHGTKNFDLLTMGFEVNAESWKKCLTCSLSAAAKRRDLVNFINIAYIEKKCTF